MKTKTTLHGFINNQETWLWKNNILFVKGKNNGLQGNMY